MNSDTLNTLLTTYANLSSIKTFSDKEWDALISQGYATGLLGRFYALFLKHNLIEHIPEHWLWHFSSAYVVSLAHEQDSRIEIKEIKIALRMTHISPVFLKGTAYLLAEDFCAQGRTFNDVDIFVKKEDLSRAEEVLKWYGWVQGDIDDYDEKYYRTWMHEIPPMHHKSRGTTLDVHHNLTPLTSRLPLDESAIQSNITKDSDTLKVEDRIIHSANHLLLEEQFDKGIRDLSDLDLLIREHSSKQNNFWNTLTNRATELGLGRIIFYALRYTHLILKTPVPEDIKITMKQHAPNQALLILMDWLFISVFTKPRSLNKHNSNKIAHLLMFIRGHWLRMPLHLLIPHLFHKSFITPYQERKANKQNQENIQAWK